MLSWDKIKGVGPARRSALEQAGFLTPEQLVEHLPTGYQDTTRLVAIAALRPGLSAAFEGEIIRPPRLIRSAAYTYVATSVQDHTGILACTWFSAPWMTKNLPLHQKLRFYARIAQRKDGKIFAVNPMIVDEPSILPVYRPIEKVPPKTMRKLIAATLAAGRFEDMLPETFRNRYNLCPRQMALSKAHFPRSREALEEARRRLAFEELTLFQMQLASFRNDRKEGVRIPSRAEDVDGFWNLLPFEATGAQRRVLEEIREDLQREAPMARLVQGDVGSGKTAIAFFALFLAARAGFQGALMAPTDVLASQHFRTAEKILAPAGIRCVLLTGKLPAPQRKEALAAIRSGEADVIIGTHALISKAATYRRLGLVITDEQHRFGVRQRTALSDKALGGKDGNAVDGEEAAGKEPFFLFRRKERSKEKPLEGKPNMTDSRACNPLCKKSIGGAAAAGAGIGEASDNEAPFGGTDTGGVGIGEASDSAAPFGGAAAAGAGIGETSDSVVPFGGTGAGGVSAGEAGNNETTAVGPAANVLVLSATPIPRTLSLILYGDLDISIVDEMPKGHVPVKTYIVPETKREGLYSFIRTQAASGRQIYIICPLVSESERFEAASAEEMYDTLRKGALSSLRVGLVHGRQNPREQDALLCAFAAGSLDVLVSTTVVEVGVDVPNATVMVIENAERFGLSQLHQLRGRVGRGGAQSYCFLMASPDERLEALVSTADGFEIARKDLEQRGPGEWFGTRQHGAPLLPGAALGADARLLQETQQAIQQVLSCEEFAYEAERLREAARRRFGEALDGIGVN